MFTYFLLASNLLGVLVLPAAMVLALAYVETQVIADSSPSSDRASGGGTGLLVTAWLKGLTRYSQPSRRVGLRASA